MGDPESTGGEAGHAGHDVELIAALFDRDLPDSERARAEDRLRDCEACAALHADLLALADATRTLAAPGRTRDFALTPAVAAALRAPDGREPVSAGVRLSGEMTDPRTAHGAHDRMRIANLLDRTVTDSERAAGEQQLAACVECRQLHDDLVVLSAATKTLPIPARPRDFALSPADADRLRVRGWRRLLAVLGSSRDVFSRPLAIGFTTLGLAGLLLATLPGSLPGSGGGSAGLPVAEDAARNASGAGAAGDAANPEYLSQASVAPSAAVEPSPAIAAAPAPAAASEAPAASGDTPPEILAEGGETSLTAGEPADRGAFDAYLDTFADTGSTGPSPMVVVAGVLLLIGLGLFGLRWTARRLGDG